MNDVAVLGCGPAGLLAAHAMNRLGLKATILSIKKKSVMIGTQYLHESIPDVSPESPQGSIHYYKVGTREGYAYKVYGSPNAPCSWDLFETGDRPIWYLGDAYHELWERYQDDIVDVKCFGFTVPYIVKEFKLVISTVPAQLLCVDERHRFDRARIWVRMGEVLKNQPNVIVYNGDPLFHWYRRSRINGHEVCETTLDPNENFSEGNGWLSGYKPTYTDCSCHKFKNFHRVGRFGSWKKGVLVHHAYHEAEKIGERYLG